MTDQRKCEKWLKIQIIELNCKVIEKHRKTYIYPQKSCKHRTIYIDHRYGSEKSHFSKVTLNKIIIYQTSDSSVEYPYWNNNEKMTNKVKQFDRKTYLETDIAIYLKRLSNDSTLNKSTHFKLNSYVSNSKLQN